MPTSVLLAVLAAAGLLALAPALVRRYDATERLAAERALNTARVIDRQRRRRTVPGRQPVNPPRAVLARLAAAVSPTATPDSPDTPIGTPTGTPVAPTSGVPVSATPAATVPVSAVPVSGAPVTGAPVTGAPRSASGPAGRPPTNRARRSIRQPRHHRHHRPESVAIYRRRRVLTALVLLNLSQLGGVGLVGAGFWIGAAPSLTLFCAYLVHLRKAAIEDRRRRRIAAIRAARLAAHEAQLRQEQAVRLATRREALRRAAAARSVAQREAQRLSQRYVDGSARSSPRSRVRGRSYEARAAGY